jgi:hypothetical protein
MRYLRNGTFTLARAAAPGAGNRLFRPRVGCLQAALLAFILSLGTAGAASADDPAKEFWPEIDTWLRLSPAWRLSLFVPVSQNLETHYREGNLILQGDYAFGQTDRLRKVRLLDEGRAERMKTFLVRGGYLGGKSLDDKGQAYSEHTMLAELHLRTPLKGGMLLSSRLRADLRWLGDTPEFSSRVRLRVMVEKESTVGRTSIVPYLNVEPYYDSRYETVNRVRLIPGASVSWTERLAVEGNMTYQYDSHSSARHVLALNVILHVFFDTSHPSQPDRASAVRGDWRGWPRSTGPASSNSGGFGIASPRAR